MTRIAIKISPLNGEPSYEVDLSEFAIGGREETVGKITAWGGDYTGRPQFAKEIAAMLVEEGPSENACDGIRYALRGFFRYLDWKERRVRNGRTENVGQVTDAIGLELRQWLGGNRASYKVIKSALNATRRMVGCRPLYWPNRHADKESFREPPSEESMRRLYHALKHQGRAVKGMFKEGERLAAAGSDPRRKRGGWSSPADRAFFTKLLLEDGVPDRARLAREGGWKMLSGPGPTYLAPGMDERYRGGISAALRWFVPSRHDTAVFFWLFLLGTGWNPSTACGIDVLDPDGWHQPHPQSDTFAVIHAWKARADRHQFAISMTRPEWHPYRVLAYIIERTAPLRRDVLALLDQKRRQAAENPELDLDREIADLEKLSRTPWLFASLGKVGTVSGFVGNNDSGLVDLVRAVIEDAGLDEDHPSLAAITTKDARLAWIGRVYVHSGYHQLLTKLAGNHGSLRTTRHYVRSMRYRAYSERQVRKLQDAVFSEIGSGRVVDPTRLRLLVSNGDITPEQEKRLADYRQRTSLGMGCLNPFEPPKHVDPDHRDGELCRVQRCTGCRHGIVFPDSMPALARRLAELMHLRRTMPMAAWEASSLADEHESIEQTLSQFAVADVEAEVETWMNKLNSGEISGHGTYPSY
jgi:hypothetical protein